MPTTITKTVKSSGGDYTSLSGWEAGQQADIVTADEIQVAECYAMLDSTQVIVDGWTTDATRYIQITVPAAERHDGKRNTSKYRLEVSAGFTQALRILEDYVRVYGMAARNTSASVGSDAYFAQSSTTSASVRFVDCLAYDSVGRGFWINGGAETILLNCVAMNLSDATVGVGFWVRNGLATNNTYAYNCVVANAAQYGFRVESGVVGTFKNCYSGGTGTADYSNAGTMNLTTCHAEDGTGNTTTAFSTSSGVYFTNVTAGSEDVHIGSSSGLKDTGTDLSGDARWVHPNGSVGINGNSRSTWDVGADEYVATGATVTWVGYIG